MTEEKTIMSEESKEKPSPFEPSCAPPQTELKDGPSFDVATLLHVDGLKSDSVTESLLQAMEEKDSLYCGEMKEEEECGAHSLLGPGGHALSTTKMISPDKKAGKPPKKKPRLQRELEALKKDMEGKNQEPVSVRAVAAVRPKINFFEDKTGEKAS
jgi:hypothetical protein